MARFQARSNQRPAADHVGHRDFMDHLKNTLSSGDMDLPGGARAPKARKPYTISKQREKWTEDEHKLFLEALQQHGRAWRRIQEHIGSKTAVQIRSHAQKFFSKVIRESSGDNNNNSVGAPPQLQIPPPRPKRRPTHPYPRKLGNSVGKDASAAIKQLRKPQWQAQSLSEQENCSPKSVLTTAQMCSEALPAEGSGSLASSVHMEDKCLTPNTTSVGGESSVQVALSTDSNDAACEIPEGPVLRLFGKRVVVSNLDQQPSSNTGSLQHAADMELDDASAETPTSGTGKLSSHAAEEAETWCPWLVGSTQQFLYYLPQGEVFSMHPGCQFLNYGNGSISYTALDARTVTSNKQRSQPWTESIETSSSVPATAQNSDPAESTKVNRGEDKVAVPVPGSRKCASAIPACRRGFVPYKKCTARSKVLQPVAPGEEADRELTRLCL